MMIFNVQTISSEKVLITSLDGHYIQESKGFALTDRRKGSPLRGQHPLRYKDYSMKWSQNSRVIQPHFAWLIDNDESFFNDVSIDKLRVLSFDIEDTYGIANDPNGKVLLITVTTYDKGKIENKMFDLVKNDERETLTDFFVFVKHFNPHIITGHNILNYDLPRIERDCEKLKVSFNLGVGKKPNNTKKTFNFRQDGGNIWPINKYEVPGRIMVDTLLLTMRYSVFMGKNFSSNGIKTVISELGLERDDRQHYDASLIAKNYKNPTEWELIKRYAEHDAEDALKVFNHMIEPFIDSCRLLKMPLQYMIEGASGGQINMWFIRQYLKEGHSIPLADEPVKFKGASSFGIPGVYENVIKVDVSAMHPSILLRMPTITKKDTLGVMGTKLREFVTLRRKLKKSDKMRDKVRNETLKRLINSFYGFLGAPGLNFNNMKQAAKVCSTSVDILSTAIYWATGKPELPEIVSGAAVGLNPNVKKPDITHNFKLVNGDTDSISFTGFEGDTEGLLNELNRIMPEGITWELDGGNKGRYDKALIVKAKNYILVSDGQYKVTGSFFKSSSLEPFLKSSKQELIKGIFEGRVSETYYNLCSVVAQRKIKSVDLASTARVSQKMLDETTTRGAKLKALASDVSLSDKFKYFTRFDGNLSTDFDLAYDVGFYLKRLFSALKPLIVISGLPPLNLGLKSGKYNMGRVLWYNERDRKGIIVDVFGNEIFFNDFKMGHYERKKPIYVTFSLNKKIKKPICAIDVKILKDK